MSAPVTAVPGGAPVPAPVAPASAERKAQVEALVDGILKRMDYPARLELKDMADGGIGVAVHFGAEALPGISPGKRTWLLDCLQFIVNKATNRPTVERRWVSLGANGFSEPRTQKPERDPAPVKAPPPPLKTAAPPPPVGAGRSAAAKPVGAPSTDGARDGGRGAPRG
ncbi:MAG: hypothetical protein INH37_10585, partial [Myxococcaceae bacterium]|nr:hypothetical protein [Myxococcaceae bacterium]